MPDRLVTLLRVVVVSPGDVVPEREAVAAVAEEINRRVAASHGCRLSVWRWETDSRPGLHLEGPQGLIDERMDIENADVVIGIFWTRFGTPVGDADSGTEHELRRAWAAWRRQGRPDVMIYFCERGPVSGATPEQRQRVLSFREQLPAEFAWWPFTETVEFERLVRGHLEDIVLRWGAGHERADARAGDGVRAGPQVWFGVPPLTTAFTGREAELRAIGEALGVSDRAVIAQSITGLGGVGKTQLAARYVHAHASEYDVVAWIRAEDGGIADLAALAGRLGEAVEGLPPAERRDLALARLSRGDVRWLLVLDNVESLARLHECLPRAGDGRVLVTSRNREVRQFAPALALDVFDPETAIAYLTERAGRPGEHAGARRVAGALGHLPLALSHAAAYCATGTSFDEYLALLEALPAAELFDRNPEVSYAQTVASTWKASIGAAAADAPLAAGALALGAHLGPDAIPKALFTVLLDGEGPSERKRLADAFNALARFSLAAVEDESVSVHRLLQKVVRDEARARHDERALGQAMTSLDDAFPQDPADPAGWPMSERLFGHVLALADAAAGSAGFDERLVELFNRASLYLIWAEGDRRGLAFAQDVVDRAVALLGPVHPLTLTARGNAAYAAAQIGRAQQAISLLQSLLADQERVLGPEHEDTLRARRNLALAYRNAGRIAEAIAIYEPLLATQTRLLGPRHLHTLTTRHELGGAYQFAGRARDAIALFEPLIRDQTQVLGADHPTTLASRSALAGVRLAAGQVQDAIAIHESVLADSRRILGADHLETLGARRALGEAYLLAGRPADALALVEPLLPELDRLVGPDRPLTLNTELVLARGLLATERRAEAIAVLEPLTDRCARALGPDTPLTLSARHELASAYALTDRPADALAMFEPLLADRERTLGPEHPDTINTRHNLAVVRQMSSRR